jgi:hypothetical protein
VELTVEKRLKTMVTTLLGGPRGDPDAHHHLAAAHTVLLMDQLGIQYDDAEDLKRDLSGNNIYEADFLDMARKGLPW